MNDCKPPKPDTPGAEDSRRGFGIFGRTVVYGIAWLPLLGLIALLVPKFEDLFSRSQENAEVPAVSEWLLWFTSLNKTLFFFPCLLVFVLLVVADVGVAVLLRHSRREWLSWAWFVGVIAAGILAAAVVSVALWLPIRRMTEAEQGLRLGRGVSVHLRVRQMPVSRQLDGPGHVLACLVWAERLRENVSEMESVREKGYSEDEQGKGISWDTSVGTMGAEFALTENTAEPAILIVMRGHSKGRSWGGRFLYSPREGPEIAKGKIELIRGDEVWAAYEATAEPFTESFMLDGKELGLDAGRVVLADFAGDSVRVQQIEIGGPEVAEAREALADDPVSSKEVERQLQTTVRQLTKKNETVREFVGDALESPSTH